MMTAGPWHGRQPRPSSPTVHAVAHSDTDIMEPPLLEAGLGRVVRRATRGGHHLQIYPEMKSRLHPASTRWTMDFPESDSKQRRCSAQVLWAVNDRFHQCLSISRRWWAWPLRPPP